MLQSIYIRGRTFGERGPSCHESASEGIRKRCLSIGSSCKFWVWSLEGWRVAKVAAAKIIQSAVRCFQVQRQLQDFADMLRGSLLWQGACRRFTAQAALLKAWDTHERQRVAAAVKLQAAQRSFRAQRELARRKAMRDGLLLLGTKGAPVRAPLPALWSPLPGVLGRRGTCGSSRHYNCIPKAS